MKRVTVVYNRRPRTSLPKFIPLTHAEKPLEADVSEVDALTAANKVEEILNTHIEVKEPLPEVPEVNPIRNVHVYDGKLEYRPDVPKYPENVKDKLFASLQPTLSSEAGKMIGKIRHGGNGDGANGYDASDLFYYLLINAQGEDFYQNLNEQLTDMYRLGQCPQGRVIRLMSLVGAFVPTSQ